MDSTLSPCYQSTAHWLTDARAVFAARILDALDAAPDAGAEVLLGCLPSSQARSLVCAIQEPAEPDADAPHLAAAAARLGAPEALADLPVGRLLSAFGLPAALGPLCALMLLPELDVRFAPLYAYLNDDAQRRYLTPALAAQLGAAFPVPMHDLLAETAPLRRFGLIEFRASDGRALPDRSLRWQDHVAQWLLSDRPRPEADPSLAGYLRPLPEATLDMLFVDGTVTELLAHVMAPLVVLAGARGSGRAVAGQAMAAVAGRRSLIVAGADLAACGDWETHLRVALRDATLRGHTLVVREADRLARPALAALFDAPPCQVILTAEQRLDLEVPQLAVPPMDGARSQRLWRATLGDRRCEDADRLAHRFRLPAEDILRITGARDSGTDVSVLAADCLARSARTLDRLATAVHRRHDWSDLVLPVRQKAQLENIVARAAHAHQVYDSWGFGDKLAPDRGLTVLFSGPSGAGKTLSAGIIARALGLPLYRVDLSATVSKYIGETEKNLDAIFAAADAGNAALFFDECDALFGKRSEVSDAHDRYANIETSFLLQRLEVHRGIVMLASNHPQNIDDAFSRRIDVTVEFPMPDAALRVELWQKLMPSRAAARVDYTALGTRFEMSGGSIRNCLLGAAFLAASVGEGIETRHCVEAVAEEYKKTGKPLTRAEFGQAFATVRSGSRG
jgi:hypothetical protein